jgi:C-terminal processing protease CtpA/Prc
VGNGFFHNYTITFNWQKEILTLAIPNTPKRKIELPTYGFGYAYNENTRSLYVNFLYNPSPASQAGLKIKDKIISINGLSLEGIQLDDYCKFLFHPETLMGKGNQIELVILRNGQTKTFTLTKKDLLARL